DSKIGFEIGSSWEVILMIHISRKTHKTPEVIVNRAIKYFGKNGLGLEKKEETPCCLLFEGVGGYVAVNIVDRSKHRMVDVESKEWDYHAKRFLRSGL
ncbi:MAG: hypothetical protein KJO34_13910, partial [Deltaproteobacteria bacterium]|nr:hypothetical protein [Deltaproteobacteria bacterium]